MKEKYRGSQSKYDRMNDLSFIFFTITIVMLIGLVVLQVKAAL